MEFIPIETSDQAKTLYPLVHQLRGELSEEEYLKRWEEASETGYRLLGLHDNGVWLGLMGFRILTDFVHGRHLYVDDLVVDQARRQSGIGRLLLERAKVIARSEDCQRLRLCTGVDNQEAMAFYEKVGWKKRAVVYKTKVD